MRLLGIDYGTKRVGLALSDALGTMAFPKTVIENNAHLVPTLAEIIQKEGVIGVVVGESKNLKGTDNPVMNDIRAFADELARTTGIQVHLEPEFYTSREARRLAAGSPARKKGAPVDAEAAAIILTSYISHNP